LYGADLARFIECAQVAAALGLHVWLSPRLGDAAPSDMLSAGFSLEGFRKPC
jgi:hypothetical protein